MKDTYRERIKEEQKKLSPSQVFFSEGYRKLFRDLANEVAGEKLEQLLLYQSTEDGLAGWNDGKRIGNQHWQSHHRQLFRTGTKK